MVITLLLSIVAEIKLCQRYKNCLMQYQWCPQLIYSWYTIAQCGVSLINLRRVEADRLPWCWHMCLCIEYRLKNGHRHLWVEHYVSAWWCPVWFIYLHEIYGYIWYVLKCLTGMAYDGLPFTDTGSPVPDVRNDWHASNLYTYVSAITQPQGYFCPRTLFENTGINPLLWNSLVSCFHPN